MRYGIPLFGDRVAPRCTHSDGVLIAMVRNGRVVDKTRLKIGIRGVEELQDLVREFGLDVLVCGGVDRTTRGILSSQLEEIVPNVSGTVDQVLDWLKEQNAGDFIMPDSLFFEENRRRASTKPAGTESALTDCLACEQPVCLDTGGCIYEATHLPREDSVDQRMIEVARDLNYEEEGRLCRLSELVYFCLEMDYRTLGVAYCNDLYHPATVLTRVLRRFFTVHPVCCKINVPSQEAVPTAGDTFDPSKVCNPLGQADFLNRLETDLNVLVGLCMGADCVFTKASRAPATALFNKDRALANNPIGAIYSERYLREAVTPVGGTRKRGALTREGREQVPLPGHQGRIRS